MTPAKLEELEKIAKAATPGPWEATTNGFYVLQQARTTGAIALLRGPGNMDQNAGNAAYIAAANPKAVLELVETIRTLREAGNLMYRAICYTSGVDLNFAADEWKKTLDALNGGENGKG